MTWIERTAYLRLPRAVSLTELREPVTPGGDEMAWARTRKGTLRVRGKGATVRELPVHPQLPAGLARWPGQRPGWPGAGTSPALLLNRRGGRLPVRGASTLIQSTASNTGLGDGITAHVGRHTFATALVRGGTDLVVVAGLPGPARPTEDDRTKGPQPALHRPLTSENSTARPDSGVSGRYLQFLNKPLAENIGHLGNQVIRARVGELLVIVRRQGAEYGRKGPRGPGAIVRVVVVSAASAGLDVTSADRITHRLLQLRRAAK